MASSKTHTSTLLFLLHLLLLLFHPTSAIPPSDLHAALSALRSNHHTFFANSITTSPLYHLLLSASSVTLFAPPDHFFSSNQLSSLSFKNQKIHESNNFLSSALHHHTTVGALSSYDLHLLLHPKGSFPLPTLDETGTKVNVSQDAGLITANGVWISQPDLYFSPSIAVHGLDGILDIGNYKDSSVLFTRRPIVPLPKLVLLGGDRLRHQYRGKIQPLKGTDGENGGGGYSSHNPGGKIRPLKGSEGEDGGGYSPM